MLQYFSEQFDNYLQHDAHEFINYLLNYIADVLKAEKQALVEKQRQLKGEGKRIGEKKERKSMFGRSRKDKIKPEKENQEDADEKESNLGERVGGSSFLTSLKLKSQKSSSTAEGASSLSTSSGAESVSVQDTTCLVEGVDEVKASSQSILGMNGTDSSNNSPKSSMTNSLPRPETMTTTPLSSSSSLNLKRSKKKSRSNTSKSSEHELQNGNCIVHEEEEDYIFRGFNGNTKMAEDAADTLTWVHEIFQGTLTNETRCLTCETVNSFIVSDSTHFLYKLSITSVFLSTNISYSDK